VPSSLILIGDARKRLAELPAGSARTCITSPPYFGLRDYGVNRQIGLEETPDAYVAEMVALFREVWRVLAGDGTLWLNLGDSYAGSGKGRNGDGSANVDPNSKQATSLGTINGTLIKTNLKGTGIKPKDLIGIPWRVAFALQADGWYLRSDIIWAKPNPMPESVTDRPTRSHEYLFLLTKSAKYYYDHEAIKEPAVSKDRNFSGEPSGTYSADAGRNDGGIHYGAGYKTGETRNKRDVWTITTKPFKGAHFAVMPEALVEPCVLASSAKGDMVLDPFAGSGTVGVVANRFGRNFIGTELNPKYGEIARERITSAAPLLNNVEVK
jgi:DNA modification methylase